MTKVVKVNQFCSDENCEFWEENPDGQMTKIGRMCPCCGTALVLQDPKKSSLTNTIPMLDTQLETEYPNTESLPPGSVENLDKFQEKVDQGSAVIPSELNINEDITSPGQNDANQNTPIFLRKTHEFQATKTQQHSNTLENRIVQDTISSAIIPSSFSTDSPNSPSGSREQASSNLNYQCAHSQSSNPINKVGDRDQAIKQPIPPFLTILFVMDPDETKYYSIRFCTLILDEFWKNIDAICLRIGTEYFNTFRTSIVPFRKAALVNLQLGKFVLINGTLQFPISSIRNSSINFAYKYYIYFKNGEEDFESLYHPYEEFNRYFSLDFHNTRISELRGCIHQQCDLMILPDLSKYGNPSFWTQIKSTVSFFASPTGNVPFYNINERRLISFQVLLPRYYKLGYLDSCKILQDFITRFTIEVTELSYLLIQDLNGSYKHHYWENNSKDNIFKLVEAWIKTTFIPQDNPMHPKAIIHHFYLACYLIQYYKLTNEDLFVKCIKMVEDSIEDILKTKSYLIDYSVCKTDKFRKEIYNSVLNFIFSKVVRSKYPEKLLLLIPIYHGICTSAKDYYKVHENLEYYLNEFWGFAQEETLHSSCELTFNSFKRVFDLMKYDKLLPYSLVIYTLNDKNANLICEYFVSDPKNCPISAIMGVLLNRLFCSSKKKKGSILKYDEKLITEVLRTLNGAFMPENNKFLILDINRLISLTIVLTNSLIPELVTADQFHQCLKLLSQSVNYCATNCPYIPQIDSVHLFHNFILKWHSIRIFKNRMYYRDYLDEIKFWGGIILNYPFPSSITLHKLIEDCLTMRFRDQNITQQYIIDLFIHLHNSNNHSLLLQDIFRKELTARLQGVKSADKSLCVRQLLEGLTDPGQLAKLNKIFNKILLDEEQEFENNTIHHLISWTSWNTYFSLLNFDNIDQIISHDAKEMLDTAVIQFCSIISQINDFSLTGEELNLIRKNTEHFLTLLEIILKTKKNPVNIPLDDIKRKLYQCFEMYEWVRNKTNILFSLNTFLENLHNLNYKLVSDFLCSYIEKEKLNIICQSEATSYKFAYSSLINEIIWFPEINQISNYCNSFSKSRLLLKVFNDMIIEKGIKFETQFDIKIFYENIWIPSMDFCIEFLQRLTSQTILISEMCKYFTPGEEMHSILSELNTLHIACRQYNNEIPETSNLLLPCAQRMQLYSSLQQCSEAAILITKLKNGLLIKSNFEIIESLKNINHAFKSKQLNQVNAQVSHTATYLGKLSKSNLDVIQAIIDRNEFIMWIRSNLKDLSELKTFVDISLTTCGGNPVDVDKITCLSSVCTNFAPIIFQIDENTSYETLIARCRQVIESVEKNKKLTKLLRQVGENVRFWEEMKKSHGSVEETTLMQLDNIINSGEFCLKIGESLNLCDIVSLSVDKENCQKKIYSLEELTEFRSKIMLVVSMSELPGLDTHTNCYENSQLFTNKLDTIIEIATIVLELIDTGNQDHLNYQLTSYFTDPIDDILIHRQRLKILLNQWKHKVEESRNRHYYLNYYTISQIVILQKGIKSFIEDRKDRDLEQLYHLLGLLNPEVAREDIQQALEQSEIVHEHKFFAKADNDPKKNLAVQSLSSNFSNQFSRIINISKKKQQLAQSKSFSKMLKGKIQFPKNFTTRDKDIAKEVNKTVDYPLNLVIRGISECKAKNETVLEDDLVKWCMDQDSDSEFNDSDQSAVTVAIHGRQASEEHLAEQFLKKSISGVKHGVMYHVDIASTVQLGTENILFKLLLLGGICNRSGELWHCRGKDYYVIEMTLSSNHNSFNRLYPNLFCVQPSDFMQTSVDTIHLEELKKEKYQRVNAYLMRWENSMDLDNFYFELPLRLGENSSRECLKVIMKHCGVEKPSWTEVRNFVSFLDKQLSDCEISDYCKPGLMEQDWKGLKSFVVKFMIIMSRDFATPFLKQDSDSDSNDLFTRFQILDKRKWENNSHPYIFFNPDRHTMTFLGFHISNTGHLIDSDQPSNVIENNIIQSKLLQVLTAQGVNFKENFSKLSKTEKINKVVGVMGINCISDPDPGYVLTLDNMRKILAILMRFRCNIPVVIMGETGCGKTRLIQFMYTLQALKTGATNMLILKVHGGTTETDVMCKVEEAEKLAQRNYLEHQIDTVLFFDEANTSPAIGLIKEIMCDRRMYGRHIRTDIGLQFIAACNPYRKHTEEMLNKLSSAGLGFFTKSSETTDRLGDIPLRELVYRVMELPASLRPLVWDFGQLSNSIEKTYTREIVARHLRDRNSPIEARDDIIDVISDILAGAQSYMRERKDECSFVSLRDVERAIRVMLWFYSKLEYFRQSCDSTLIDSIASPNSNFSKVSSHEIDHIGLLYESSDDVVSESVLQKNLPPPHSQIGSQDIPVPISFNEGVSTGINIRLKSRNLIQSINKIDYITYSLILSLAVCYRARLQERESFDKYIINLLKNPLTLITNYQIIQKEIDRCQQLILDEMTVGANIARNIALKENVFMMFVCIELKIPLFVIGKPGSSKSLAKSIISNSMQGSRCPDGSILQNFKQVQIMSYQCSQLSTADGIIGVFNSCRNLQRKTGSNKFTACVVLDEVGLAEDSPLLPLKVLHPLLEDSSYGSECGKYRRTF